MRIGMNFLGIKAHGRARNTDSSLHFPICAKNGYANTAYTKFVLHIVNTISLLPDLR